MSITKTTLDSALLEAGGTRALARALQRTAPYISRVATGRAPMSASLAKQLAAFLGLSPEQELELFREVA